MHASSFVAGFSSSFGAVLDDARDVPSTVAPSARFLCRVIWSSSRGNCDDSIFSLSLCGVCGSRDFMLISRCLSGCACFFFGCWLLIVVWSRA